MPPPIAKDRSAGGSAGYDAYSDQNPPSTQRGTSSVNYAMSQTGHKRSASSQGVNSSKFPRVTRQTSRFEQNDIHEQLRKCETELGKATEELQDRDQELSEYAEDYEKLEKEVNHLRATIEKLEKQKEKVERKNNQLAETVDSYRAVFNDKGEESAMLKRELASIKNQAMPPHQGGQQQAHRNQDVRSYLNIIKELKNEKAQLISKNSGLEKQLVETRGELLREISELQSKNNFNPKKISDTDIQRSWKHIGFLIRQFVDTFVPKGFSPEELQLLEEKGDLSGVSSLCATPNAVLQCGMTAPLLMQALLWNFLHHNVFDFEARHWAGDLGKKFSHVFGKLWEHVNEVGHEDSESLLEALHEWRSRSVDLFCRLGVSVSKDRKTPKLADAMIREIVAFIPRPITQSQAQSITQDAIDIIDAAAKLDLEFRLSKAHYTAFFFNTTPPYRPQFFGYAFDATRMEQTSIGPRISQPQEAIHHLIDLAVSPGLVKVGNTDGTNYHSERVLVKMEVCCNIRYFIGDFQEDNNIEDGDEDVSTLPDGSSVKVESQTNVFSLPNSSATEAERCGNTGRVIYTIPDSSPIKAERFQEPDELSLAPSSHNTVVKTEHGGGNYNVQRVTAHADGEDELAHTYNVMLPDSPAVKSEGGVNRVVSDQMLRGEDGADIEMHDASSQSKPGWPKGMRGSRGVLPDSECPDMARSSLL